MADRLCGRAAAAARSGPCHADAAAGHEPDLAVGDDRLAGRRGLRLITVSAPSARATDDGAQIGGLIRLHDEHVLPLLSGLHRGRRHDDRASDPSSASRRR